MFRKSDSSGDLAPAVERLHALADRLESVLSRVAAGGTAPGFATTAATINTSAPPSNSSTSSTSASSPLADWASRVTPALAQLRAACSQTAQDPEIEALTDILERAFAAEEAVLRQVAASSSPPPPGDDAALERLLAPVAVVAEEANKLANPAGGRGKAVPKRLNQAKAVSELIPALLWVAYSGPSCGMSPPAQHVDESWQAAEFFANKAALEFRGSRAEEDAEAQALWLRELRALAMALKEHVRVTAPQGPAWGVGGGRTGSGGGGGGGGAPPPPPPPAAAPPPPQQRRAAPPPPPPPPPPGGPGSLLKKDPAAVPAVPAASAAPTSGGGGGGGGMAAVLAAIASKGDAATKGLRKVTDEMKSKSRGDRSGAVPAGSSSSAVAGGATPGAPPSSSSRPLPPPRLACEQGRKWVVENYRGAGAQANHDASSPVVVDGASAKQSVYVFGCSDVVVKIVGKVNAVSVDSCSRAAVEVDGGVVASVEAVNSKNIVLKNDAGLVSTWALDKCSGVSLMLSRASLEGDAQVTTAQCSEVNIVLPEEEEKEGGGGGNGDDEGNGGPAELPVPEQFVTRVVAGKLVTEPVAHSGA